MTREQAIACANNWVSAHFAVVPRVATALLLNEATCQKFGLSPGKDFPQDEWERVRGKWLVSYMCSWDTDALGLPQTLHVQVDDSTGEAEKDDLYLPRHGDNDA